VLTSSPDPKAEGRSLSLGASAFYRKPDTLERLGEVVKEIVENNLGKELTAGPLGLAI
jgi:hypothetical protein